MGFANRNVQQFKEQQRASRRGEGQRERYPGVFLEWILLVTLLTIGIDSGGAVDCSGNSVPENFSIGGVED